MGQISDRNDQYLSGQTRLPRRSRVLRWLLLGGVTAIGTSVLLGVILTTLVRREQSAGVSRERDRPAIGKETMGLSGRHNAQIAEDKVEGAPVAVRKFSGDPDSGVPPAQESHKAKGMAKLPDESSVLEQTLWRRLQQFSQETGKKPGPVSAGLERRRDLGGRLAVADSEVLVGEGFISRAEGEGLLQSPPEPGPTSVDEIERQVARSFLDGQAETVGLAFQEAAGYWSNSYVPGDPAFRLLQARLLGGAGSLLTAAVPGPLRLHNAARRTWQPFDPPVQAAMAVYLHAEERTVNHERRMIMQVGLQATHRRSGLRPAMNVALVLDLREALDPESAAAMRGLVLALGEVRDLGDRFRLFVAGCPGGELVQPEGFRHGSLLLAMNGIFGLEGSTAPCVDLPHALENAVDRLSQGDDPHGPLGSSVVLLVATRPLGADVERLAELAHSSAVSGIPWSVVGLGASVELQELDHLALAGQGNRRLLRSSSEARGLIDGELSSVSRVVARALRLRIRLAPGVELVEILGSQRLDQLRAEAVRESERSIDLRLARNLGIEADRGEDEEGIQIVIPSFYAGDSHVVLLDVVVPGPGPVADVTVRYKDLVYLRNGVTRDNLSLGRGSPGPGPLEVNVTKNLLAFRLFETLDDAADAVARGDLTSAREHLSAFRQLLAGLRGEIPGFENDPDITTDLAMLEEYLWLLGSDNGTTQGPLVDSLRYAGRLKILPAPPRVGDRS